MNENVRPTEPEPDPASGEPVRRKWLTISRTAVLGIVWAPILGALVWFVPKFKPIFVKLHEKSELPFVTELVMTISDAIRSPFGLPALAALVVLLLADIGV
jgi:type II secretory pathway component PulF